MSLALSLSAAIAGLQAAQNGLDITAQNVANVNTEGYTRKEHNQVSWVVDGNPAGVKSLAFSRVVDESLIVGLRSEVGSTEELAAKETYMLRITDLFGSPSDDNSISHKVSDLKIAFDELATNVNNIASQSNAVNAALDIANQFQEMSTFIQEQRSSTETRIDDIVDRMNVLLEQIDTLNTQISRLDTVGIESSDDYKDQRDQALLELSGYIDIKTFTRETGEVVVMTENGTPLLSTETSEVSYAVGGNNSAWTSYDAGNVSGIYAGGVDITNQIKSGELKGLIDIRDDILPNMQAELDELAYVMREQLNQVHNSGTSYPNMTYSMTGDKTFMDSANQSVRIADGDVKLVITDANGEQVSSASLLADMGMPAAGESIDDLATRMQTWLRSSSGPNLTNATVEVDSSGQLDIDLHSTDYSLSFRDESSTDKGSEHTDALLEFDVDGDGTFDTECSGFSNFFGLNNLFDDSTKSWIYDSQQIGKSTNLGVTTTATLSFSDEDALKFGSVEVEKNDTLYDIAEKINEDSTLNSRITASVIEENGQYRLRIMHLDSQEMAITEDTGTGLLDRLGMGRSYAAVSTNLTVDSEIADSPTMVSRGAVQYDETSGEYYLSSADNETAIAMSGIFDASITFKGSGTLAGGDYTITDFATSFVSGVAEEAESISTSYSYQSGITEELSQRNAEISGVNLDEEMAKIMVYENAYAASARILTATEKLFDILNDIF